MSVKVWLSKTIKRRCFESRPAQQMQSIFRRNYPIFKKIFITTKRRCSNKHLYDKYRGRTDDEIELEDINESKTFSGSDNNDKDDRDETSGNSAEEDYEMKEYGSPDVSYSIITKIL
nr:CMF_HP1_G0046340.mRNA.1.CDS.1 [Saccharomyces cerevisiae]